MLKYCIDAVHETRRDKAEANYGVMVRINSGVVITREECHSFFHKRKKGAVKITALIRC